MNRNKRFFTPEEVVEITNKTNKILMIYENNVFDVTEFLHDHPGGSSIIEDYNGRDISEVFFDEDIHEHSTSALNVLLSYKIGEISDADDDSQEQPQKFEVKSYPQILKNIVKYKNFQLDTNRGIIDQVYQLKKSDYLDLIEHPFHTNYCRLYDKNYMEFLTRNKWYTIATIWLSVSALILYWGLTFEYPEKSFLTQFVYLYGETFSWVHVIFAFLSGILIWSHSEYCLHRFLFHCDWWLPDRKFLLHLHFLIHGIHHTIPMDPDRLVFPPILGAIVYAFIFPILSTIFVGNFGRIIIAGFLTGYVGYDLTHYFIHHGDPKAGHFKEMKSYHNKHHYKESYKGYGITSKIWDLVYGTAIQG